MKRKDLVVGAELYHARPYERKHNIIGNRVRVVATEPWCDNTRPWDDSPRFAVSSTGPGVLVSFLSGVYRGQRSVVQLAHLHGPYAEVLAEVEKAREEDNRRKGRERAARNHAVAASQAVVKRATDAGYDVEFFPYRGVIEINRDVLARLLTAAGVKEENGGDAS